MGGGERERREVGGRKEKKEESRFGRSLISDESFFFETVSCVTFLKRARRRAEICSARERDHPARPLPSLHIRNSRAGVVGVFFVCA